MTIHIITGDCRDALRTLAEGSVDAIVCDPPYELGFMGKAWDRSGVAYDLRTWREALRVAKPGAYLLAFGGTRTFHRVACAIEDAGWELRDTAVRGHAGENTVTVQLEDCPWLAGWMYGTGFPKSHNGPWGGTALKPAWEPIIMARKPLIGTVAANVQQYGTGGLNIDGCRIESAGGRYRAGESSQDRRYTERGGTNFAATPGPRGGDPAGRWPANILHDGSDEVLSVFPFSAGQLAPSVEDGEQQGNQVYGKLRRAGPHHQPRNDAGSAARFFWSPKASRKERGEGNTHPTVKPVELMAYLCRLVTPPGGTVLDPFMGSGSTGIAASREGFSFIGIELDGEYAEIARRRIFADAPLLAGAA